MLVKNTYCTGDCVVNTLKVLASVVLWCCRAMVLSCFIHTLENLELIQGTITAFGSHLFWRR